MRYTVHPPRIFHNRITKRLGVLVGAALLIALGLPGVAQAQVPAAPTATYEDDNDTFTVMTEHGNLESEDHNYWVFEYDSPSASAEQSAVITGIDGNADTGMGLNTLDGIRTNRAEGKWTFRVRTIAGVTMVDDDDADTNGKVAVTARTKGAIRVGQSGNIYIVPDVDVSAASRMGSWSAKTPYTHGAPPMPDNFTYISRPSSTTHIFTWSDASEDDAGIVSYTLRWTSGDITLRATKWEMEEEIDEGKGIYTLNSDQTAKLMDGKMYTFELRAIGESSSTVKVDPESASASTMVQIGMGDDEEGEGPTPAPTLPEIAALFLAMLLLGSGAYQLRRRQSGGLTRA